MDVRNNVLDKAPLWTRNYVLIIAINWLLFLGFQFYPSALPPYVKSLGADDAILGWITGISTISTMLTRPLAGVLLDKLGRRGVLLSGLALMSVVSASMYFFPLVGMILVLRFIHGLGWGVASTATPTIAADYIPKARLGEGMGYFSLSASFAMAVSPAIALSMRPGPMFILATSFMAASFILAQFLRYKSVVPPSAGKSFSFPYEKAALNPAIVMLLVNMSYGAVITFLAVYAAQRGIGNIGPYFTVYAIVMMLTRPYIGKLVDRKGQKATLLPGLGFLLAAQVMLSQSTNMTMFLLSAALYGIGQGAVHSSAQTLAILNSPENRVGAANATFSTGFDAGIGGGAVLSSLLAVMFGYSAMFLCLTLCPVLAAAVFLLNARGRTHPL
jgi:MFS family permease